MNNKNKGIVIWDWNGTLLDDVDICIESMNMLLSKRNLFPLTKSQYKQVFTFPVKDYYADIGFDFAKEPFDKVAVEFIDTYREKVKTAKTYRPVKDILAAFSKSGFKQFLISAMEHEFLKETLTDNDVLSFLDDFSGINDHHANGKLEMARQFFAKNCIEVSKVYLIGDTIHDFEVAEGLGVKCILIADGHQSSKRLKETGAVVLNELTELIDHFQLNGDYKGSKKEI